MIPYIENQTERPYPMRDFDVYDTGIVAPEYASVIDDDRARFRARPSDMLRPHSRLYWLTEKAKELVAPPDEEDKRWRAVREFLYGDPADRVPLEKADQFEARVFRDLMPGEDDLGADQESLGAWSVKYRTDYFGGTNAQGLPRLNEKFEQVPLALRVGDIPWADGIDNAGHYDIAVSLLRCYLRNRDEHPRIAGLAWQFFVKRALYEAGQVTNHRNGQWRYEKSSGPYVGDFYPDGYVQWSHSWPSGLLLFAHLTGQLQDVAVKVAEHIKESYDDPRIRHQITYERMRYGPRPCAWWLRAVRCAGSILGPQVRIDDDYALSSITTTLEAAAGSFYSPKWIRQLQADRTPMGAWDAWLWLGEALPWLVMNGEHQTITRLGSIARWMARWNSPEGQVPYTIHIHNEDSVTPRYTSATHTALALPAMAGLVAAGQLDSVVFERAFRFWARNIPFGCRGWPAASDPTKRDLAHGGAAPKIMADHALALVNPVFDLADRLGLIVNGEVR